MKLFWSDRALKDLDNIIDYYITLSEQATMDIVINLYGKIGKLIDYPESGQKQALTQNTIYEIRYLVESNWKVLYSLREDIIYIETIFDTRQNPAKLM
jgi:toxin ParE1/3/4